MQQQPQVFATREQVLSLADRLPQVFVPVPELGANMFVALKVMSGEDRDSWDGVLQQRRGSDGNVNLTSAIKAVLVSLCATDEYGKPLFSVADAASLARTHGIVLNRLYDRAFDLNRLGGDHLEAAAKNSSSGPSGDSGTSSPEPS